MILCYFLTAQIVFWNLQLAAANTTYPNVTCKTVKNKDCVFPFIDGDVLYEQCAPHDGEFWCAVSVKTDNVYKDWDFCDLNTCSLSEDSSLELIDADPHARAPPNNSPRYYADYLGRVVIKMFQSFGAQRFYEVPRDFIPDTIPADWNPVRNEYGVYLFFMGKDMINVTNEWNNINGIRYLERTEQKSRHIIPWYVGKHKNVRKRLLEHNRIKDGAITKWRRMMGYRVNPNLNLTRPARPIPDNQRNGFQDLYFTYIPLRPNEIDNILIETIFLNLFNFPNNFADNHGYRNGRNGINVDSEPPDLYDHNNQITEEYYSFTREILNTLVLYNMNRFYQFLYNEEVRRPNPHGEGVRYTQDTQFLPIIPIGGPVRRPIDIVRVPVEPYPPVGP